MSSHVATVSLTRSLTALVRPRRVGRHRATTRPAPARHASIRQPRHLLASVPVLLVGLLALLAVASPQARAASEVAQPLVRVTTVAPEVVTVPAAPVAPERIEEDDPRWDCRVMGNGACGEQRTDPRFPGVTFHYVTTYDASGAPLHTYTQRQYDALQGQPLTVSTATDRY